MSQLENPPAAMPFRLVSKTIGSGAYASIKKAIPLDSPEPVFAVKFIHKAHAMKHGHITPKQLAMESSLHSHIGHHANVIEWFASGEDAVWRWIAMEYAEGGDLFDKIEADVGVPPDIAQLYFLQLVAGVSFVHSKGVAHRDLKPENIMLSGDGILKLADFGMATMFEYKGQRKASSTLCGSPPYIAPEIFACGLPDHDKPKYMPDVADIWSCGVILFVLLVGNTPWDEPSETGWEFQEYVRTSGRSSDALWTRVPADALSLLRGMMRVDPGKRFNFTQIRQHPWATRHNPLLTADGEVLDPLSVATRMLENLHIDFSLTPTLSHRQYGGGGYLPDDADAVDSTTPAAPISYSQPEAPANGMAWEFERPALRTLGSTAISSTQPSGPLGHEMRRSGHAGARRALPSFLADEPAMSQFSQNPGATMTMTQQARKFRDIVPAESLTRFLSHLPPRLLVQMLSDALHQLNVPLPPPPEQLPQGPQPDHIATLHIRAADGRHQKLRGQIAVDRLAVADEAGLLEVRFVKIMGDPLEWRRFFKKVVVLCKEGVYVPEA